MAKPTKRPEKRRIEPGAAAHEGRVTRKAAPREAVKKLPTSEGAPSQSSRYTPPSPHLEEMPSPMWVPILMFTLWGLGMLVIFLNYLSLLPGAVSNWYLLLGLGCILGGIITATQYR